MKNKILIVFIAFLLFFTIGCEKEKKLNLKMSSTIDYIVRNIDGEYHLLKVSLQGIEDLHIFKNVPRDEYINIVFIGFENNKGYFALEDDFYYIDFDTDEEIKLLENVGKSISSAKIMNDKIYFNYDSYDTYRVSTNAKSINEIENLNNIDEIQRLSFINDQVFDYDNNKIYFIGKDDNKIYLYEYDVSSNTLIPLIDSYDNSPIKPQRFIQNFKLVRGNIIFSAYTNMDYEGDERLYVYNLNTKIIKEIGKIEGQVFQIEVYNDHTVMYRDKEYQDNVTLYDVETNQRATLNDTSGFEFANFDQGDSLYLHYKDGIYYRASANIDNVIYGAKLVNKKDLIDKFEITDKNGNKKEVKLIEILKTK